MTEDGEIAGVNGVQLFVRRFGDPSVWLGAIRAFLRARDNEDSGDTSHMDQLGVSKENPEPG